MKKAILLSLISLFLVFSLFASDEKNIEADKAAIKQAALGYIEGWYDGDAERMEGALHPDLTKRGVQTHPKTDRTILSYATASMMVEFTRAATGKMPKEQQKNEIIILDVFKNTASVKAVSVNFVDYLHLAKCNGKWVIVNALWELNK